ncbi:replicative DNA helicase [Parvularcula sp. LCG005]|uniref:replicative DNA helicase n=1 Tax=Parvularcula sp. LCG005 TaxID=3078805 RepID=UPI002943497D|nr:replicative DNA helicase [Parvularcula sp. LCG005]WOI52482.1 replicative DNA helicase [Parvularcula sp. LCG005]
MADGNPHPKAEDAERIPYSLDSEQAVLGAILFDNEVYYRVSSFLKSEHYYDPVHAMIYDAMEKLISSGRLASPVMLNTYLKDEPAFTEVGGEGYLSNLARSVPSTVGAPDYAKVVFDLAVSRGLIRLGTEMIERAKSSDLEDSPDEQLSFAEAQLYKLAETGKYGSGFKPFGAGLTEAIELANAAYQRGGGLAGISTGFRDVDKKLGGLHPSDLIILAGRPSMGKTALVTNIALNVARAYKPALQADGSVKAKTGAVVGFFSLEMADEQLAGRILSDVSGVPSELIRRGEITQADFDVIYEVSKELHEMPLHIDDTGGLSIAQVAARARRLKRQHGLGLLIIDYLQLLSGSKKSEGNRVQELTEITTGLKALAKELEVPVIALSQLSRQVEQREDKKPQLSDLRESGSIEQDADVVLFVFREEYYLGRAEPKEGTAEHIEWQEQMSQLMGKAEVIIGKQRHGPIGNIKMAFDAKRTRFDDLAEEDHYPRSN